MENENQTGTVLQEETRIPAAAEQSVPVDALPETNVEEASQPAEEQQEKECCCCECEAEQKEQKAERSIAYVSSPLRVLPVAACSWCPVIPVVRLSRIITVPVDLL